MNIKKNLPNFVKLCLILCEYCTQYGAKIDPGNIMVDWCWLSKTANAPLI